MDDVQQSVSRATDAGSEPGVTIAMRHRLSMLDLRVERGAQVLSAIGRALGLPLPPARMSSRTADGDVLRLAPDQWLLVSVPGGRWSEDMPLPGATLCDVSSGRVVFRVSGPHVRDALAKGCMLDLHPRTCAPGSVAQTAIAKIAVIVHRLPQDEEAYDLYAAHSYTASFRHWLTEAAAEYTYRLET